MEFGEEKAEGLLSVFVDAIAPTPCLRERHKSAEVDLTRPAGVTEVARRRGGTPESPSLERPDPALSWG